MLTEVLQGKRNNYFVYEPIFVLKRGKFAHVPGASAGYLSVTQQKQKLPDIFKCADTPVVKCTDIYPPVRIGHEAFDGKGHEMTTPSEHQIMVCLYFFYHEVVSLPQHGGFGLFSFSTSGVRPSSSSTCIELWV
jgi:hypothetical protein